MATQDGLPWKTLDVLTQAVRAFLDPVLLDEDLDAAWTPAAWTWTPRP
ncbi:hypothetical protein [Myxococcus fulvus]|nr:hypothetical protein [Myxococcus fulvus]MCK8499743.1 hypothetical protein [Myxococcus fulvus]